MNEDGRAESPRNRWWLDPALARLAFGAQTRPGKDASSVSIASAMAQALDFRLDPGLDLDDPAQRVFGDYELIEEIGRGGMGVVYRARQHGLDREVAIKLLSAGAWAPEALVDSLRREARHTAKLQHPNIVTVHDMGEHAGLLFYAMQLVRGRSLSQQLDADGPMPARDAARLLRTVAEAVDYAHRLGVLHLDLKPGNILIDERGAPLVADFGLARRIEQALDDGLAAGTPSYMAPEQAGADGPPLSPATDVWALGAVLYEMLTGRPPFEGADATATVHLLLTGRIRNPSRYVPVPADLEAICLHCLERDPAARYPSARALADDLGRFLEGRTVSVRPLNVLQRTWRWAQREPWLAATTAAAALALLVGITATTVQKQRADINAAMASERLWESRREAALRAEMDGNGFEAMPRLLQNIDEQEHAGRPDLAALDRQRLGMLLAQGATLIDTIAVTDATPMTVELSDDGSLLAIAFNDRSVRWYDTATLSERGRVSLAAQRSSEGNARVPLLLRFSGNQRLRATFEWYFNQVSPYESDSWLIDLERRRAIEPPPAFADFADASYSADGRFALLRNKRKEFQWWQVEPWRPLSARVPSGHRDYTPALLGPRHAITLGISMRNPRIAELPGLDIAHWLPHVPGDAGLSAWALSGDGRTLALGDFEGRLFLLDLAARTLRTLPAPRGREITWVAFSEDDAWLAAVSFNGVAQVFDVASGDPLVVGEMAHDFTPQRVGISRRQRLLLVAGEGRTALWRLPPFGTRALPPHRLGAVPAPHGLAARYPIGWSLRAGLLASAGLDGQVRLWRLPPPATLPARAARQIPEALHFDGRRLVDVEWNRLRIVTVDGAALTPWITLEQPPGFAELVGGGERLIVTVGPQLRIYDSASLRLLVPPVALPNSPQRLLASADGAQLLLTYGDTDGNGFVEILHRHDGRSGRRLPGEIALAGPLRRLALSPGGERVLAVGRPLGGATTVLASDGLRVIGDYPHDEFQPVSWADFADGDDLWLVLRAPDPRLGDDAILRWDPERDVVVERRDPGQTRPLQLIATAAGPYVLGLNHDMLDPGGTHARVLPHPRMEEHGVGSIADGQFVARAFTHHAQLYDLRSGEPIGPPLYADIPAMDYITQLVFAPDRRQLLARSKQGHWIRWPLVAYTRPTRELRELLARLDPLREDPRRVRMPTPAERAALRAQDPGAWRRPEPRPEIPVARQVQGGPIPARAPGTSPLLLDLSEAYSIGPESSLNTFYNVLPSMRPLPAGVQRIRGVDYDLRGIAQYGVIKGGAARPEDRDARSGSPPRRAAPPGGAAIPVPDVPIAAVRVLMTAAVRSPIPEARTAAMLRLYYRDGGRADIPIRTQHELPGYSDQDRPVPLAWGSYAYGTTFRGYRDLVLSDPRLPNPHPHRRVRALAIDSLDNAEFSPIVPAVFAITIEPAAPHAARRDAVISAPVSRTTRMQTPTPPPRPRAAAAPARRPP